MTEMDFSDVQMLVHSFQEQHGHWPMWLSVQWRLAEEFGLSAEEADGEIADNVRDGAVAVNLDQDRKWVLSLRDEVEDSISVWLLQPDHEREDRW